MKSSIAVGAFALAGVASAAPPASYDMLWKEFQGQWPKVYVREEEDYRFSVFKKNVDKMAEENAKGNSYRLGLTEFSDMTEDEFASKYLTGYRSDLRPFHLETVPWQSPNITVPESIDWVTKGGVTPVKNQGSCGSCWAFSSTGSLEGAYFVATGKLVSLSEENLVQCDQVDSGCKGGLMDNAFGYVKSHGIASEAAYPYTSGSGTRGTCKTSATPVVTITGHVDVPNEDALKQALALQPVSVAIEADKPVFQSYVGGVLDKPGCGTNLDHGVLVVGYGTDGGKDYWKVKNSWGASWGESGYIRLARGTNYCGIATQPSYPTGAKAAAPGPSPGPSPPAPPAPPAPGSSHYEDPKDGCQSDEISLQIQGVQGAVCSPTCTGIFKTHCPSDVPTGVTAKPQCALKDGSSGAKYCALICSPSTNRSENDAQCGGATCKSIQGTGICTYDDDMKHTVVNFAMEAEEIVV